MKKWLFISTFTVFVLVITVCITIAGISHISCERAVSSNVSQPFTVVIDAGHGAPDGGAVAEDGTCEKDINLRIAFCLRNFCELGGYPTVLTRQSDALICDNPNASLREQNISDIHKRLKIAENTKNSILVSIHLNKFSDSKYSGAQVFYSANNTGSKTLAECIRQSVKTNLQPSNTRQCKVMDSSVYIIYNATMPAVLVECGFLSNKAELENLKDSDYQEQLAFSIFSAIDDYFSKY